MSMNVDIHHLAAAYALDALDAHERAAFEAHYASCDICSRDVGDFRATLAALGGLSTTPPPAALRARLLQQISSTRQLSPLLPQTVVDLASRRRRVSSSLLAAAAAMLLVIGTGAFLIGRSTNGGDAFATELEHVLAQSDAHVLDLDTASDAAAGHVRVAWSPTTQRAAVIGDGLPAPGDGRAYELWLIGDSGPVPMRLLDSADHGAVRRIVSLSGTPRQWGVTIEPSRGSPAPTGDILFLSAA
jgi:anti-sigma-K factor RskA